MGKGSSQAGTLSNWKFLNWSSSRNLYAERRNVSKSNICKLKTAKLNSRAFNFKRSRMTNEYCWNSIPRKWDSKDASEINSKFLEIRKGLIDRIRNTETPIMSGDGYRSDRMRDGCCDLIGWSRGWVSRSRQYGSARRVRLYPRASIEPLYHEYKL